MVISTLNPTASKGSLETVKRVCQRMNEVMTYAVNTGAVKANPLAGIRHAFKAPKKNNMPALQPAELPELMQTFTTASIKLATRCLIEWQLHTMVRPVEAAGARWEEVNFEKQEWHIPPERMKHSRPHIIPLTPEAMALLELMRPVSGHRTHIFPGERNPLNHINEQTANMALKRMGFKDRLVAHSLRSIASTIRNEQGFDADIIESALAHTAKNTTRSASNRAEYLERRRVMMNWWSQHITAAATGNLSLAAGAKALRAV